MKGGIYSDQKCAICGAILKDDGKTKLGCPDHPDQIATQIRVHFGKVKRRFETSPTAQRFLTGLRYTTDEKTFDKRDYTSEKPLSFSKVAAKWLAVKKKTVRPSSYRTLRNYITKAHEVRGNAKEKRKIVPSPFHSHKEQEPDHHFSLDC